MMQFNMWKHNVDQINFLNLALVSFMLNKFQVIVLNYY